MYALGALLGWVARLYLATLRVTVVLDPALRAEDSRPWVLSFWHHQQLALLRWPRRRGTVALVSLSRDGELSAGALRRVGLEIARGSSSRGGALGLRVVLRRLRGGLDAAFAVDGPKGPRRVVRADRGRSGAERAASGARGVVVPLAAVCEKRFVLARSWDRLEIPRPFSRVAIAAGPPLLPDDAAPGALAEALDRAQARAVRALAGEPRRLGRLRSPS